MCLNSKKPITMTEPIPRSERVAQAVAIFENHGPFTTFKDVCETFIKVFDEIELSVIAHNTKYGVGSQESIVMSVPAPQAHTQYPGLYFSVATRHIMIFSDWGAMALYHKIPGVYDEILLYKTEELTTRLFHKLSACGRGVWDFEPTQKAIAMNIFSQTHAGRNVSLRNLVHAFFTELYNDTTTPRFDEYDAHSMIVKTFVHVREDAMIHNQNVGQHGNDSFPHILGVPVLGEWKELGCYKRHVDASQGHTVYHAVTTHQYLLIASNGAIEFHQAVDVLFMKTSTTLYQNNVYNTRILSLPGDDGKNVWGYPSERMESFSANNKVGMVIASE